MVLYYKYIILKALSTDILINNCHLEYLVLKQKPMSKSFSFILYFKVTGAYEKAGTLKFYGKKFFYKLQSFSLSDVFFLSSGIVHVIQKMGKLLNK